MHKEHIELKPIADEMQESYLDYAMSVIVARALPDVRDGLKPVHRRILYAMWHLGLRAGARFRKSATVVGEVLGKYHPHGDAAVYDALVRLAQDFSMRYPLVKGQGNFGSIDGDAAAAMRYTETKLQAITEEMLFDLEKETILLKDNYDGTHKEPSVLPAKIPNLLLNGTLGIAVGMATNIPPHNLREVCDAVVYLIKHKDATVNDLTRYIKGPDFPTKGMIFDEEEIKRAYATGRGSIVMRAKAEIVDTSGGFKIIIDEIPYQVNKAQLIEKIAELVKEEKIKGIKGLRDESDRQGLRIAIELKKDSFPKKILNQLYKYTRLQDTFHVNMLALIDGIQPRILTLKMVLEEFIRHRQNIIIKRTEFDLKTAREREHILVGLAMALENIDAIVETIKKSNDRDEAKINLIKKFKLTERQAEAILQMRLQTLAGLERIKVEKELQEKRKLIDEFMAILKNPDAILNIIIDELEYIKKTYGDSRKTIVIPGKIDSFSQEDLIPKETAVIVITKDGYIKRIAPDSFKSQARGGKGVIGLTPKETDSITHLTATNTHADLLFFTTFGKVFQLKTFEVPEAARASRGQSLANFLEIDQNEYISAILVLEKITSGQFLVMATERGVVKKVSLAEFAKVRRSGLIAIKLKENDILKWVKKTNGAEDILLTTKGGFAIRFHEKILRSIGRAAYGVAGIRLSKEDSVVGMDAITEDDQRQGYLLVISKNGYGKMTKLTEYKVQARAGKGIKTINITKKTEYLTLAQVINLEKLKEDKEGDLMLISTKGQVIRMPIKTIPIQGRATQGVRLMKFKEATDKVAQVTLV